MSVPSSSPFVLSQPTMIHDTGRSVCVRLSMPGDAASLHAIADNSGIELLEEASWLVLSVTRRQSNRLGWKRDRMPTAEMYLERAGQFNGLVSLRENLRFISSCYFPRQKKRPFE